MQAGHDFVRTWTGRGYEKGDTASFWLELLRDVVGMADVTTNVRFEERTIKRGFIDVVIADVKTFIEQKSLGADLDKPDVRQGESVTPFRQAFNYANTLPNSQRPDFIIVCDFNEFRIHDLNKLDAEADYISFTLAELPDKLHLLNFLIDPQKSRQKREEAASMDAGALIGKLYDLLRGQYLDPDSDESQHALNVLCVRLVFCLFAEDAGLFPKDALYAYLKDMPAPMARTALKELFEVLNTPVGDRDPYLRDDLKAFPYVNGGLFQGATEVPPFTDEILDLLVNEVSMETNWAQISPHHLRRRFRIDVESTDPPFRRDALHQPGEHPQGHRPAVRRRVACRVDRHSRGAGADADPAPQRPEAFSRQDRRSDLLRPGVR